MTRQQMAELLVKSIRQPSPQQICPEIPESINLNTCADPDCGNSGVAPEDAFTSFKGRNAVQKGTAVSASSDAMAAGPGQCTASSAGNPDLDRFSDVLEYANDPHGWQDEGVSSNRWAR